MRMLFSTCGDNDVIINLEQELNTLPIWSEMSLPYNKVEAYIGFTLPYM